MARIAVLASGVGTNLQALLDDPVVGPQVVLVVSDRPQAAALERAERAERAGIETIVVDPSGFQDRDSYDSALAALLGEEGIDCVVLAGFMRILGPALIRPFAGKIINVHPSLLPAFPGSHSIADAVAWGSKVTGVTVHLVDEEVDHGPIIAQEALVVRDGDDPALLESRIHEIEHRLLPAAVRSLIEGRLRVEGRVVRVLEEESK